MALLTDKHGNSIEVGSKVRILSIDQEFIEFLPEDEQQDVASIKGKVLEVDEIDEYNQAWVTLVTRDDDQGLESRSLALSSSEIELVK